MSILNKNSDRYDALGIYPRVLFDMTKFEEYKYVTKGDDWDCVLNKNQFIYELNTCTYEESKIISAYLDLNGWYHHKIKFDDRIFKNKFSKFGSMDQYSLRYRNWIYSSDEISIKEFPWTRLMGLGYIRSTVYVPVTMKIGGRYSYDKFISLIDHLSEDLNFFYPYIPSDVDIKICSNLSNLTLENGMKIASHGMK